MNNFVKFFVSLGFTLLLSFNIQSQPVSKEATMAAMVLANRYFMEKWPDVGKTIITERERPSNIWTRGTYYEGLMALYKLKPDPDYLKYAVCWGEFHKWGLRNGVKTRNGDDQCCGQTYIDLYLMDRSKEERIRDIKTCIDNMIATNKIDDWSWIDAIHMSMPVFARLGFIYNDPGYFDRAHEMYLYSKLKHGDRGLYSTEDHLWWRDKDIDPPYKEPNGQDCYWSRGNGWVVAALVRTLEFLGFVQGTGKEPKDSQPVGYDTMPNFEDFGLGCFLLAGSEVYKLK